MLAFITPCLAQATTYDEGEPGCGIDLPEIGDLLRLLQPNQIMQQLISDRSIGTKRQVDLALRACELIGILDELAAQG